MKFLDHIKLAVFTGLVVGTVLGTVDIIIRIAVLSFEWFELYQSLLIPLGVFVLGFFILGLFMELIRKIIKLKAPKKTLTVFYFTSSIALLIIFYGSIILNRILIREVAFWSPLGLALNVVFFSVIIIIWFLSITKAKDVIYAFTLQMKKRKVKKFAANYIFAAIIFIIISLFLDIYLLNYAPSFVPKEELKGYPNILFIEIDTLRADHLGLYGYPVNTTPNIDELAKDAVVFDMAIGPAAGSQPSTSSMAIGKYLSRHGTIVSLNAELDIKETTLAETLKAKGYITAGFVSGVYIKAKYGLAQGFDTYNDRMDFFEWVHTFDTFSLRETLSTFIPNYNSLMGQNTIKTEPEVNEEVFKWLKKNNKYQPFYLYVHYIGPHSAVPKLKKFDNPSNETLGLIFKFYDAAIKYTDSNVEKLLNKIDELGIKDNTIIIITADHGQDFYDHGILGGESMFQSMIHIPLIIRYPGELNAQRIRTPVSTIDIFPTLLDMLDIEIPEDIDGVSLLPLMKGEGTYGREFVASETYGRPGIEDALQQIAIIKGDWKLIEIRGSDILSPGLYNLRTDPNEQRNLYDVYIEKRKELQQYIPEVTDTIEIEN